MKTIYYWGKWENVEYGKSKIAGFDHWSNLVEGKGDESLKKSNKPLKPGVINFLAKVFKWKKYVILVPSGDSNAEFRIGYYNEQFNLCQITPVSRKVSQGPYAMRMSPEDCKFFVVGNKEVKLDLAGYVKKDLYLY